MIKKGVYFFYGGYTKGCVGEIYIVNMIEKTVKPLKSSMTRAQFASVFKNEKIYLFGGWISDNSCTISSQTYNLKLDKWTNIQILPSNCYATTASIMNNEIIITGYDFDKVYEYNGLCYSKILNLSTMNTKSCVMDEL